MFSSYKTDEIHDFYDKVKLGKRKVLIVKQVGGQGDLHDNQLFTMEPSAYNGGRSNIDLRNVPVVMTPNEYRGGAQGSEQGIYSCLGICYNNY